MNKLWDLMNNMVTTVNIAILNPWKSLREQILSVFITNTHEQK